MEQIAPPRHAGRRRSGGSTLPISVKLVFPMLFIAVAGASILAFTVYRSEANRIRGDFAARAFRVSHEVHGDAVAHGTSDQLMKGDYAELQSHLDSLVETEPSILRVDLIEVNGGSATIMASTDHSRINRVEGDPADLGDELRAVRGSDVVSHEDTIGDTPALHATVPVQLTGEAPFVVAVHMSTVERDKALAALLWNFALGVCATVVLATIALVIGVRILIFRRLERVLAAFNRLQSGDFNARAEHVPSDEPRDEMLRLAARFNNMAASVQELHAQIEEAATTDHLTGLYNRRFTMDALNREIARARRQGEPLSVIMVDLDGLKQINDRHGHSAGDEAIRHVAACLSGVLRGGDYAARVGGDEFVAVLPNCDPEMLGVVIERLQSAAREAGVSRAACTVSAGGAVLRDADDADSLLHRADEAMYDPKRAGKDQSRIAA
jgi:diguanylate cyclase (GGDEF)-like protein